MKKYIYYKMEIENSSINLNPKYIMLLYDVPLMKKTMQNLEMKDIFNTCPTVTFKKNTLFYHASQSAPNKELLNKTPSSEDKMTPYYFNFLNHYQHIIDTKQTTCEILWNFESLKLLDLTGLCVELGFNPIMYDDEKTSLTILNNYCKKYKLDGFITFNTEVQKENLESNYHYIRDNIVYPLSPSVYLTSVKEYGNDKLKTLSFINLKKLTFDDATYLNNLIFCNIVKLIDYGYKNKINLTLESDHFKSQRVILKGAKSPSSTGDERHDLTYLFEIKNAYLLSLLIVSNANLKDQCDFKLPLYSEMSELTETSEVPNIEITYDLPIKSENNELFNLALNDIAINNQIKPFVYVNYNQFENIDYLSKYNFDLINEHYKTMDDLKRLLDNIENTIILRLNYYYKKTDKGYKSNINFFNLQYIPSTNNYIKKKIMNELNNLDTAIEVLKGDINKNIVKYFNVNNLYHSITNFKYSNPKLLYQDLLNDLTNYKRVEKIDLKWLKIISQLSDANSRNAYNDFLKNIYTNIYDYYKNYLNGSIMFYELYEFLGIDNLRNFLIYFANNNDISANIIINYSDIVTNIPNYSIENLKKELDKTDLIDIEFFTNYIEKLKMYIVVDQIFNFLLNHYQLEKNDDVVKFLKSEVERIIDIDLDSDNSYIKQLLLEDVDWVSVMKNGLNLIKFIRLFELNNDNTIMLDKIYKLLDIKLNDKTRNKLLKLTHDKNLLYLYINYLKNNITLSDLSEAVFSDLIESHKESKKAKSETVSSEKEKKEKKSKKSKKKEKDEESM